LNFSTQAVGFALAIAIGLLVGRSREAEEETGPPKPGLRDSVLVSLLGALCGSIGNITLTVTALAATAGVLLIMRAQHPKRTGITTELAELAIFLLGYLCLTQRVLSAALAITLALILERKTQLHRIALQTISEQEYGDILKYLALVFVLYPLLPKGAYGPLQFFEPRKIWLFVILVSGISFIGYFLTKFVGPGKGLQLSAVVGGLASTTASTAAISRAVPENARAAVSLAGATLLANCILFPRTLIILLAVSPQLAKKSLPMLSAMLVVGALASWMLGRREAGAAAPKMPRVFKNPFTIGPALRLGVAFTVILFLIKAGKQYFGSSGQLVASGISGLIDVDPVSLSLGSSVNTGGTPISQALFAILVAIAANSVFKTGLAVGSRNSAFYLRVAAGFGLMLVAGAVVLYFVH